METRSRHFDISLRQIAFPVQHRAFIVRITKQMARKSAHALSQSNRNLGRENATQLN